MTAPMKFRRGQLVTYTGPMPTVETDARGRTHVVERPWNRPMFVETRRDSAGQYGLRMIQEKGTIRLFARESEMEACCG